MLCSTETSCSTFRWSAGFFLSGVNLSSQEMEIEITPSKLTGSYDINPVPVLRRYICSPVTWTRQLFHSYQEVKIGRLDLLSVVCVTYQIVSRSSMHHAAEELVNSVTGWCPRSTNSAPVLQFQDQKRHHVWLNRQCHQHQLKWLLMSSLPSFSPSVLQNGGKQERRTLASWLKWQELIIIVPSGNCPMQPARHTDFGEERLTTAGCEKTFLYPELLSSVSFIEKHSLWKQML